jgi:hypothetical protein
VQGRLSLMFVSLKEFITWEEQIKSVLLLYLSAILFDSFKYVGVWVWGVGGLGNNIFTCVNYLLYRATVNF